MEIFLSEIIADRFLNWDACDNVFIQTQTGSGKTTFILEILSKYAMQSRKEVLLLVNRKMLKNQIRQELAKEHGMEEVTEEEIEGIKAFGGITVLSYQEVQEQLKRKPFPMGTFFQDRFRYVVFDECHYILEDALFNRYIPYLLDAIPKTQSAARIFLSATLEEVFPFLVETLHIEWESIWKISETETESVYGFRHNFWNNNRIFFYLQEPEFKIRDIRYFRKLEEIREEINQDGTDDKWLIFVNSKNEAKKIKENLNVEHSYLDADADDDDLVKRQIERNSGFESKVLITTKILDNGVNLKDRDLKHIVLMTTEKTEFLQMFGRKRYVEGEEGVNLYIMERGAQYFNFLLNKRIRPALKYMEDIHDDCIFRQERFDDKDFYDFCQKMALIIDGKIIASAAAERKLRLDLEFCSRMIEALKENPHALILEQLSWVGRTEDFEENKFLESGGNAGKKEKILEFMEAGKGKKLNKEKQEIFRREFAELAQDYGVKLTDRGSRLAGKAKINKFCKDEGIPFRIIAVSNSKYWEIKEAENAEENVCD